jgi:hypothetical protein
MYIWPGIEKKAMNEEGWRVAVKTRPASGKDVGAIYIGS